MTTSPYQMSLISSAFEGKQVSIKLLKSIQNMQADVVTKIQVGKDRSYHVDDEVSYFQQTNPNFSQQLF